MIRYILAVALVLTMGSASIAADVTPQQWKEFLVKAVPAKSAGIDFVKKFRDNACVGAFTDECRSVSNIVIARRERELLKLREWQSRLPVVPPTEERGVFDGHNNETEVLFQWVSRNFPDPTPGQGR